LPSIAANRGLEPKKLSGLVHGELDWIVMKALEKDRARRYETANGLAMDVQRYLRDEAVQACPPSTMYRFRKYARRNKAGLLAAFGVVVILVVLVVVLAVSNRVIAAQRNETAKALREKERALAQAEAQGRRADASFWKAVISVREVMTQPAIGWPEASPALRRQLGEASLKFYQNLLQESGGDPNVRYEAAVGYRTMGTIRTRWQEYPKAEQMFRQAIEILDQLVAEHPENRAYRYEHAYARLGLAHMLDRAGRPDDAVAVRARAIELCEALVAEPPDAYDHLVALATLYRDELEARGRAATTQQVQTCIERASALHQRALVAPRDPVHYPLDGKDPRLELGHRWRELAFALVNIDRFEEAEQIYRRAIETFEQFRSLDPPHAAHYIADTLRRLGRLQVSRGQLGEAEQSLRRAVAIHGERAAKFPDVRWNDEEWAAAYLDLARLLIKTGRPQEAAPLITRAAGFDDPDVQNSIAWRLATDPDLSGRDPILAVELAQRAIATRLDDGNIWNTLGAARYRNGQPKEAIAAFEKSMELRHGGEASDWFFLAMCHWQLGQKDAARKWYDQAVVWTDKYQPNNRQLQRFRTEAEELLKIAATRPATKEAK
jgi:tetratricopeptide (TPR) repeat protein